MGAALEQDGVVSGLGLSLRPTELDGSRTQKELSWRISFWCFAKKTRR